MKHGNGEAFAKGFKQGFKSGERNQNCPYADLE